MTSESEISSFMQSASNISRQVSIPTIFNVLLWILPLPTIALIIVSFGSNFIVTYFLMGLIGVVVSIILILYIVILKLGLKNRPDLFNLIRSEDHAYKMKLLDLKSLGDEKKLYIEIKSPVVQNNPTIASPTDSLAQINEGALTTKK